MGHHKDREAKRLLQGGDQLIELGGADRVKTGRWLVKKQKLGIKRERPRQKQPA